MPMDTAERLYHDNTELRALLAAAGVIETSGQIGLGVDNAGRLIVSRGGNPVLVLSADEAKEVARFICDFIE